MNDIVKPKTGLYISESFEARGRKATIEFISREDGERQTIVLTGKEQVQLVIEGLHDQAKLGMCILGAKMRELRGVIRFTGENVALASEEGNKRSLVPIIFPFEVDHLPREGIAIVLGEMREGALVATSISIKDLAAVSQLDLDATRPGPR